MIGRRALLRLAAAGPALSLAGLAARCASPPPPPPPPPTLDLTITGGADQNPGPSGTAQPVAVRLIQLNASAKFERADVFALTEREKATLGEDDAGSEEFVIRPGETRAVKHELKKGVQFLGAVVQFRDIDSATWRAFVPVAPSGPTKLALRTAGTTVTLAPA